MLRLGAIVLLALLGACSGFSRPTPSGPSVQDIFSATLPNSDQRVPVYKFESVTSETAQAIAYASGDSGLTRFGSAGVVEERLRRGDVIEVTVLDTGEEGILSSTESKTLELGRFTVAQNGTVTLPFVGQLEVLGASAEAVQTQIVEGLRGSAVNPQAIVRIVEKPTSTVTVSGNVNSAGRFPLTSGQERVLDAIALAGGSASAPGAARVTLIRGSQQASAPLERIIAEDRQNVFVLPGDRILVEANEASFTALGLFKNTGEFEFEASKLTLAEALGRTGGLSDGADPRNVYLFRNRPAAIVAGGQAAAPGAVSPAIYYIDMSNAANFAYMQKFQILDGDVLYAVAGR